MCGLSGYVGIADPATRLKLVEALGLGVDERGGHSCGYVTVADEILYGRKPGTWWDARDKFRKAAASGSICMMHARFATCGSKQEKESPKNAHPFRIERNNKPVIWGAHNGVLYGWQQDARKLGYNLSVDSQLIFELIADNRISDLNQVDGYGMITWLETKNPQQVQFARLSSSSEFYICSVKEGGFVWASTRTIVEWAIEYADLHKDQVFDCDDVGRIYIVNHENVWDSEIDGIHLKRYTRSHNTYGTGGLYGWGYGDDEEPTSWDKKQINEFLSKRMGKTVEVKPDSNGGTVIQITESKQEDLWKEDDMDDPWKMLGSPHLD